MAIARAGVRARGATLYVTLEPCDHQGLTAPCSRAILAAGLTRVVVAGRDSDPRVRGLGLDRLRRSGLRVEVGLLGPEADRLNQAYHHFHATGRPFVELKLAASLDGKIALQSGPARWITGPEARREGHRLRARADAVLIGAGTLRADDPRLTVRGTRGQSPIRVVWSRRLALPLEARVFHDGAAPTWVVGGDRIGARAPVRGKLRRLGVPVIPCAPRVGAVLQTLGACGVRRLLVEGGAEVASEFLAARFVDRIHLHLGPILQRMSQSLRLESVEMKWLGADLAITGMLPAMRLRRRVKS
jgi:diaminohydroxyphosphoribosylaminopyrimidine deaminase/5-amino-6-(5-phosphoribosylamino)uracil reductase